MNQPSHHAAVPSSQSRRFLGISQGAKMRHEESLMGLPSEMIIEILSWLPIKNIVRCKCVCKPWLNLLNSPVFVKSHLSKSKPGLFSSFNENNRTSFDIYEFDNSGYKRPITSLGSRALVRVRRGYMRIEGTTNGLLFLRRRFSHYICNPITREYIKIQEERVSCYPKVVSYGFGVSNWTGKHKMVRILDDSIQDETLRLQSFKKSGCQVHTLGTGSWRSIAPGDPLTYDSRHGEFLNGNLHWLVKDLKGRYWISCFDLETEQFSTFSVPSDIHDKFLVALGILGDCLCLLYDHIFGDEIVIWSMKEYGVDKSWRKEIVINDLDAETHTSYEVAYHIKLFKDGHIPNRDWTIYYSNKTKSFSGGDMLKEDDGVSIEAISFTPSFLSPHSFAGENASSF